jgi:hypothetical protein
MLAVAFNSADLLALPVPTEGASQPFVLVGADVDGTEVHCMSWRNDRQFVRRMLLVSCFLFFQFFFPFVCCFILIFFFFSFLQLQAMRECSKDDVFTIVFPISRSMKVTTPVRNGEKSIGEFWIGNPRSAYADKYKEGAVLLTFGGFDTATFTTDQYPYVGVWEEGVLTASDILSVRDDIVIGFCVQPTLWRTSKATAVVCGSVPISMDEADVRAKAFALRLKK